MEAAKGWAGLPGNVRGAAWMVGSALCFSSMAILVKYLGHGYSPALQTLYRQAAGLVILAPVILRHRGAVFATGKPWLMAFRSATATAAMTLSFYAFQNMPLADANALSFTRALWVVPLAAFYIREHVGAWRIGASLVGFGGVLVMLAPAFSGNLSFGLPALAMLASAFLFAFTVTSMKVLTRDHGPMTLLVWAGVLGAVFALPGALLTWRWPTPADLGLLSLMGVFATGTMACYIKGMSAGDAAAMAPVDYTRLIFTALAGFILFGEVPTVWTIAGAILVVGSTLVITWRELALARSARLAVAAEGQA